MTCLEYCPSELSLGRLSWNALFVGTGRQAPINESQEDFLNSAPEAYYSSSRSQSNEVLHLGMLPRKGARCARTSSGVDNLFSLRSHSQRR